MVLFWDYKTVDSSNNQVVYENATKTFSPGYWTFSMIKQEIESFGNVTLKQNSYDNSCTLTLDQAMDLTQFGVLLGFSTNKKTTANTATKSNRVNINRNLEFIKILCDSVDRSLNSVLKLINNSRGKNKRNT